VGIGGCLGDGFESIVVLLTNTVCGDVFRDFGINRMLIRLINLDDLLDLAAQVTGQQVTNGVYGDVLV
jgi:hypothetical protein